MVKSKSPTVRALDELKAIHIIECGNIRNEEYAANEGLIKGAKSETERNTVEQIVGAINSLDIPYRLEHTTVRNVRNYSGSLRFDLIFDANKSKECRKSHHVNTQILAQREDARKKLDEWYLSNLYNIAGRETISEFKV